MMKLSVVVSVKQQQVCLQVVCKPCLFFNVVLICLGLIFAQDLHLPELISLKESSQKHSAHRNAPHNAAVQITLESTTCQDPEMP